MVQLHEKMNFLRQKVLKRAFAKLPNLTDKERRIIDIMTQRLEHKFLREPMTAMNSAAGTADEERYRDMICELFLLNDSGEDYIGDENRACWLCGKAIILPTFCAGNIQNVL